MIPIQQPKKERPLPNITTLQLLLLNGQVDVVQQILDANPNLKFKIENGILVDSVVGAELWLKKFITEDAETIVMKQDAKKLSKVDDEVLIVGETGTGKELIARAMIGDRTGKFIAVNCAGLPKELIESELFGHKAGAFTGAMSNKIGMLAVASKPNAGVIFLDEIGELPLGVQGTLLRALQEKVIRPVGANEEVEIACKFVCATHRDLKLLVKDGLFRQDLYARISTFELNIKPLRARKGDIIPIVKAIGETLKIQQKAKEFLEKYSEAMVNDALDLSLNVRSLEQAIKRFNVLGKV
jgi:two-component system response regulator PilR (NtrC family)